MTSIEAFIRARLDEDEQSALLASPWPWHLNDEEDEIWAVDDVLVANAFALSSNQQRNTARFIARHDPARVLREVAAKRRILDEVVVDANGYDLQIDGEWRTGPRDEATEPLLGNFLMRLLALPFVDHPDYDPSWTPA